MQTKYYRNSQRQTESWSGTVRTVPITLRLLTPEKIRARWVPRVMCTIDVTFINVQTDYVAVVKDEKPPFFT